MSTPPPTANKSAMARTLERLKARKKSSSPLVKLSDKSVTNSDSDSRSSSMPSPASSNPNMITYSYSQNDGTVKTVPLAQVDILIPPKTVKMTFLFACHVLFNVPVTENQRRATVQRDYVVQVFNYGTVFVTGSDVNDDLKSLLAQSKTIPIQCTFHHDDPQRKSFNYVEVFYNDVAGTKFLKPASAVITLKTILNNEPFFIQESAFKRIDDYFRMEFKDTSLITFTKLLGSRLEDFPNINMLPQDAKLFLEKVQEWIEESSEIEVIPSSISDSGYNESESELIMANNDSKYFPLTLEQEVIVTTCVTCLHTFTHAVERLAHYDISFKCKQALDADPNQLENILKDVKNIRCSKSNKVFENVWKYCLHRDSYPFDKVFPCCFCTAVLWSAEEFITHSCTKWFLSQSNISYFNEKELQVPSNHESLLTCKFCNIKPFQFISGLVIHLFDNGKLCRQHLLNKYGNGLNSVSTPLIHLSEILLKGSAEVEVPIKCNQCSIEFQDQVSYLLHLDHHQLKSGHQIECKVCKQIFKSSCQFHKHNCKVGGKSSTMGCLICMKLDPNFQSSKFNTDVNKEQVDIEIKEELIEENGDTDDGIDVYIEELEKEIDSDETYETNYNRKRSLWKELGERQEREEWFLCLDCTPHKIVKENDPSYEKHFEENADHYKINPSWYYSKFQLYITDIAKQKKYQNIIKELKGNAFYSGIEDLNPS